MFACFPLSISDPDSRAISVPEFKFFKFIRNFIHFPICLFNSSLWSSNVVSNSLRGVRATRMNTIDMSPLLMAFVIHWKEIQLKASMTNLLIIIREVGVWVQDLGGV